MQYDFSKCKLSNRSYGGSEKKLGIIFNDHKYMLKFQKNSPFGLRYNHISEYLGSHIYAMCQIKTQETILGVYKGQNVVACLDFVEEGMQFVPFNDVGESTIETDKDKYQYSYLDIVHLLETNQKITSIEETISCFFEMYIIDALTGNFDRHGANWGFLKRNNIYELAPIFDNGSCLYPQMINEDEMQMIITDEEEIEKRIYKFPTSQIKLQGNKSSYFEVISSLEFEEINKALLKIFPRIDLEQIYSLIDSVDLLTDIHKEFYKVMLKNRYEKILEYSYLRLLEKKNEQC